MTLLTGTVYAPGGSAVTGSLYLTLSQSATLISGGLVSNTPPFIFQLTAGSISGPRAGPYSVPGADAFLTAGLTYAMDVTGKDGELVIHYDAVSISGTTVDLGTLAPVTWFTPLFTSASGTLPLTLTLTGLALTGSIAITPANSGGAVALQASTPGTPQTGNANLTGDLIILAVRAKILAQGLASVAGQPLTIAASNAVAGSLVASGADGGNLSLIAGDGVTNSTNPGNGGIVRLIPGAGAGVGFVDGFVLAERTLEVRNSNVAQIFRVYGTANAGPAAPTDYERLSITGVIGNYFQIATEAGGAGGATGLKLFASGTPITFGVNGAPVATMTPAWLAPNAAAGLSLGGSVLPWSVLYLSGTSGTPGTNRFLLTGASTGGLRTIALPDASGTVALVTTGNTRVSVQFNKTDSTLAAVTGLAVTVVAGRSYGFEAVLHVNPNGVGGENYTINGSATATNVIWTIVIADVAGGSIAVLLNQQITLGSNDSVVTGNGSSFTTIKGLITVNAGGTIGPYFAQGNASGTSSVLVGSTFRVWEIA